MTPNDAFDGLKALEVIERGEGDPLANGASPEKRRAGLTLTSLVDRHKFATNEPADGLGAVYFYPQEQLWVIRDLLVVRIENGLQVGFHFLATLRRIDLGNDLR